MAMNSTHAVKTSKWTALCALATVMIVAAAGAQEVVSVRASASANHTEKVKKTKDDGFVWLDVEGKDTYRASVTFTLDAAPTDWRTVADDISVTVGNVSCSPDITKSSAKGGTAKLKEKDKEFRSNLTCTVKWSKRNVTLSLSGSNYDGDTIIDTNDDEPIIDEEIDIVVDVGDISCEAVVAMRGARSVKTKTIRSGRGEDAEIEDFELINWRASGSARLANGVGGLLRFLMRW